MGSSAYTDEATEAHYDGHVGFIGSAAQLQDAEIGSRVHYEGKLAHCDPQPRGIRTHDEAGSPRERPYAIDGSSDTNTVRDILLADNTGVTQVTWWGILVWAWHANMYAAAAPFIYFTNLRVAELPKASWHGACTTRNRVLHSTHSTRTRSRTTLCGSFAPTSPWFTTAQYTRLEPPA